MNNLARTIADVPILIIGFILIFHIKEWVSFDLTISVFSYFVLYFWIILYQLSYIIFGGFENKRLRQYGEYEAFKRVSIALVLFGLAFFSIAIEMAKATALSTSNIAVIIPLALITSIALTRYRYMVLTYFGIKKGNGIKFSNIKKYIRWYHYGAVIIFLLFNSILFL